MPSRPALLPVDHPLSYSSLSLPKLSQNAQSLEEKVQYLIESQRLRDLLAQFAYSLDACLVDPSTLELYVSLFTDDCHLAFPFGTFSGKVGLPEMVLKAESRFQRMCVSPPQFRSPPPPPFGIKHPVVEARNDLLWVKKYLTKP